MTVEGFQGPYSLSGGWVEGANCARVRAGVSEWAVAQTRRWADYTVDYERGHVAFTPEIPIGVESRVIVEYQVIDAGMRSRLMGIESRVSLAEGVSVGTTLIRGV